MICRNCGKEFEGQFCPHCGHDSSKPTKAEKASKRKESVDKVKEKLKPASDFVKKHKLLVIIVAAVLAVAIIVGTTLGVVLSNDFRVGKMNQIKIGMTKAEVEKKLGKPHEDEASTWTYYSKNYKKLVDEAKKLTGEDEDVGDISEDDFESALDDLESVMKRLEELEMEAAKLTHDEILIRFSSDKVYAVEMRKDFNDETRNKKREVKKARLSEKEVKRFATLQSPVYAIVEYKDGSYRNAPVVIKEQLNTDTEGKANVKWHDEWSDTDVTAEIKVVKSPDIYRQGTLDNGDTEYFIFEENGKYALTILGNGTIPKKNAYPWDDLKETLVRVSFGNGVTSIGSAAFQYCSSLISVEIPSSVTSIGSEAFRNCSSLVSVVIGNGVTSIGSGAFNGCNAIESLTCPTIAISYIPKSKLKTVVLTSGDRIGSAAFQYCSSLESVEIPNSVTSIGSGAFNGCSSLVSVVIGNGVTSIGSYAFNGCSSLETITVAEGNTTYHSAGNCIIKTETKTLIVGCNNSIIPTDGSVTSIGSSAFYECSSLVSIEISSSVTYIGSEAFYGCSSLESIEYGGKKAEWKKISKGSNWNYNTGNYTVTCTDGTLSKAESMS